jgi:hypothetical protein
VSLPIFFVVNAFRIPGISGITIDFGVVGMITLLMAAISLAIFTGWGENLLRLAVFATASSVVFLLEFFTGNQNGFAEDIFFGVLAILVAIAVRYDANMEFKTTPTDYLILVLVLAIGILTKELPEGNIVGMIMVKSVVLFYAAEIIINRENRLLSSVLAISVIAVSSVLSLRGLSVI